jgi:hypothetical protein
MPNGPHNKAKVDQLALHVACGGSVAGFARDHDVPRRTAYLWRKSPGFQQKVDGFRDQILDKLVGRLARLGGKAVTEIGVLAKGAENESVRLSACRAILQDLISIGTYAATARQFAAMESRL